MYLRSLKRIHDERYTLVYELYKPLKPNVDENVSLFVIFKLPVDAIGADRLDAFLKDVTLTLEVSITETPKQTDPNLRREKFEGVPVYTTTLPEDANRIIEEIDGYWHVAWGLSAPISLPL